MCSLGPALLLTVVGYVSECGRERMVGLLVQLAFTPQPYPAPVLPRILLLWLLPRARLRRSVVRFRRCRCSLVVLVAFLRSRETRVTCGFKAGFASKPYSRVAEDLVFCFLLVVVVVVVDVCSCLSSSSSLRSRDECHVWFRVGFRPQTFSPGLLKLGFLCFFRPSSSSSCA